jgi:hypothetical protein
MIGRGAFEETARLCKKFHIKDQIPKEVALHKKQKLIAEADCVVVTSADGIPTVVTLSREEIERLILAIKDDLCIPDSKWSAVVEVFHLSDKCTLYQIRKRREIVDGTMGPITSTKGEWSPAGACVRYAHAG